MRKDDLSKKTFFRSGERVFQVNGAWWFAVREGEQGPFESRVVAQQAFTQFTLDVRTDIELDDISRLDKTIGGSSGWDISNH